jgi:hypothetical protein
VSGNGVVEVEVYAGAGSSLYGLDETNNAWRLMPNIHCILIA